MILTGMSIRYFFSLGLIEKLFERFAWVKTSSYSLVEGKFIEKHDKYSKAPLKSKVNDSNLLIASYNKIWIIILKLNIIEQITIIRSMYIKSHKCIGYQFNKICICFSFLLALKSKCVYNHILYFLFLNVSNKFFYLYIIKILFLPSGCTFFFLINKISNNFIHFQ
jgi:hypothetical protein